MEKVICHQCGSVDTILDLYGYMHCALCNGVVLHDKHSQEPETVEEGAWLEEHISRVSFHTEGSRFA